MIHESCIPTINIPYINKNEIVIITGISDKTIKTVGTYNISLFELPCKFHIVQNDFAVKSVHGILGSDFLDENKVIINYEKKVVIMKNREMPFFYKNEIEKEILDSNSSNTSNTQGNVHVKNASIENSTLAETIDTAVWQTAEEIVKTNQEKLITGLCKHNLNAWNMFTYC